MNVTTVAAALLLLPAALTPENYREQALAFLQNREPQRAAALLDEGLKNHPSSALLEKTLGSLLFRLQPADPRAGELLRRAAAALPRDPEAHHFHAQWALFHRQYALAVREARTALDSTGTQNPAAQMQAHTIIALAEDQQDHAEAAAAAFLSAWTWNRKLPSPDPTAAYEYVKFLDKEGEAKAAGAVVDELLRRTPQYGPAHLWHARRLAANDDLTTAAAAAERALTLAGQDTVGQRAAHVLLARLYFQLDRPAKAAEHQAWLTANPEVRR